MRLPQLTEHIFAGEAQLLICISPQGSLTLTTFTLTTAILHIYPLALSDGQVTYFVKLCSHQLLAGHGLPLQNSQSISEKSDTAELGYTLLDLVTKAVTTPEPPETMASIWKNPYSTFSCK
jgi:hypothetical protein